VRYRRAESRRRQGEVAEEGKTVQAGGQTGNRAGGVPGAPLRRARGGVTRRDRRGILHSGESVGAGGCLVRVLVDLRAYDVVLVMAGVQRAEQSYSGLVVADHRHRQQQPQKNEGANDVRNQGSHDDPSLADGNTPVST
jgi:hypothetical protein